MKNLSGEDKEAYTLGRKAVLLCGAVVSFTGFVFLLFIDWRIAMAVFLILWGEFMGRGL